MYKSETTEGKTQDIIVERGIDELSDIIVKDVIVI